MKKYAIIAPTFDDAIRLAAVEICTVDRDAQVITSARGAIYEYWPFDDNACRSQQYHGAIVAITGKPDIEALTKVMRSVEPSLVDTNGVIQLVHTLRAF